MECLKISSWQDNACLSPSPPLCLCGPSHYAYPPAHVSLLPQAAATLVPDPFLHTTSYVWHNSNVSAYKANSLNPCNLHPPQISPMLLSPLLHTSTTSYISLSSPISPPFLPRLSLTMNILSKAHVLLCFSHGFAYLIAAKYVIELQQDNFMNIPVRLTVINLL